MTTEKIIIERTPVEVTTWARDTPDDMRGFGRWDTDLKVLYVVSASWRHWGVPYSWAVACSTWLEAQQAKLGLPAEVVATRRKAAEIVRRQVDAEFNQPSTINQP